MVRKAKISLNINTKQIISVKIQTTNEHFKESDICSDQESKLKWNVFLTFQILGKNCILLTFRGGHYVYRSQNLKHNLNM